MTLLDPNEEPYTLHFQTEFTRILKADQKFLIAGYASPKLTDKNGRELPDLEGDAIDLGAMDEALKRMMKIASRRNLMGYHSNTQIGEILFNAIDSDGALWKTHVVFDASAQYPKQGLFIVAELFQDIEEAKRYVKAMQMGHMLSFSIGGEALETQKICSDGVCRKRITVMDLHEVSSCEKGINPEAKAFVLKSHGPSEAAQLVAAAKDGASLLKRLLG